MGVGVGLWPLKWECSGICNFLWLFFGPVVIDALVIVAKVYTFAVVA